MRAGCRLRLRRRGSALVLFTFMLFLLIPLIGLAFDMSMVWLVKAKLQGAVDGAALGAGRLLGTTANTTEIAGEYLKANFPVGYWSSYNLVSNITHTKSFATHKIDVSAKVYVPATFLRFLGIADHMTVAVLGEATRKDTRVVLVLDRSYSMNALIGNLQSYSIQFVNMFTPGVDQLGLVVFGTSAIIGYPQYTNIRPYDYTISSTNVGGPDPNFATVGTSPMTGPMITVLNSLVAGGNTGMADALSLAYIELQKAHMIDATANGGVDDRLNSIVFFTDGVPNAIAAYPNDPNSDALKPFGIGNGKTTCTNAPDNVAYQNTIKANGGVPPATRMIGSISQGQTRLCQLASTDTTMATTSPWTLWWVKYPGARDGTTTDHDLAAIVPALPSTAGCGNGNLPTSLNDLRRIPARDIYGNSTDGTGYTNSTIAYNGTAYDPTKITSSNSQERIYHVTLASWNAVDNVGQTIRKDANLAKRAGDATNLNIAIYVIGYQGNGGTDAVLLKRLANTQDSTSYDATQPSGLYVEATDSTGLAQAFQTVASELLRLAK